MSPALLFPLGLAALAGLVVPLLIHLRRRTEDVPTDFAALRWLEERPRPRQRVRFDEWPLLIMRLLLIALLALLLAGPVVYGADDDRARVLIAPGVDPAAVRGGAEADVRWLAPGFPAADAPAPTGPVPLASLIRQFDAELPAKTPLTIVVPRVLQGVDAAKLRLTRRAEWRIVPGAMARPAGPNVATPGLAVRYADANDVRYLRAAAAAWAASARFDVATGDTLPAAGRVLVWLKRGAVPAGVSDWIARGGTALLAADAGFAMPGATTAVWRDASGAPLVEGAALERGRVLRFTRPLTPAAMPELLEPDFPARLRAVLMPPASPPARVAARDYTPVVGVAPYPLPPRDLAPWLAVLIAALFLAERWLATSARRAVAP